MTGRLTTEDMLEAIRRLPGYDEELLRKTGLSLRQIACRAAGVREAEACRAVQSQKTAVVRVTSGQGIIENFAEAVHAVLAHMGTEAFIAGAADVAGLAEAVERKADIAFLADDDRFVALSFRSRAIADNARATAQGYVAALDAMAGGLRQRPVLVIGGAGQVGWNAVLALESRGAKLAVFDPDQDRVASLTDRHAIVVERDLEDALRRSTLVLDASPAAEIIHLRHITSETFIAAPGIPRGLTEEAYFAVKDRLIHDVLEIGVATMLIQAAWVQ